MSCKNCHHLLKIIDDLQEEIRDKDKLFAEARSESNAKISEILAGHQERMKAINERHRKIKECLS